EDELKEAGWRKDEFLAMLAHELRNPLAPIRTSLENMKVAAAAGGAVEPARRTIERQGGPLGRLGGGLAGVAGITPGQVQLRTRRVELAAVVAQAVETSRPLLDARGVVLSVTLPDEPLWLEADLARLAQVISNLLNNAAKFTERGGLVRLTAE